MASELLETYCATWAALEPRFWTISPSQHLEEIICCAMVAAASGLAAWRHSHPAGACSSASEWECLHGKGGDGPNTSELRLGALLVALFPANLANKVLQAMTLSRAMTELTLLPCHVYTALCAFSLLGTSHSARVTAYNLSLYCAWMPLLALAFPDLDSARSLSSPLARSASIGLFVLHHTVLLCVPAYLHRLARAGRYAPPAPRGAGLLQYIAAVYMYVGVLLCSAALLLGRNLNYSLWPPNLPAPVLSLLGGSRYRVVVGACLAFVLGPFMRQIVVPAAAYFVESVGGAWPSDPGAPKRDWRSGSKGTVATARPSTGGPEADSDVASVASAQSEEQLRRRGMNPKTGHKLVRSPR